VALEKLAHFKVTREHLKQGLTMVEQVAALKALQEREKTAAQNATKDRDAAVDTLSEWLTPFRAVARIALAHIPQHLETLQLGTFA
jgi:hypothetical protein